MKQIKFILLGICALLLGACGKDKQSSEYMNVVLQVNQTDGGSPLSVHIVHSSSAGSRVSVSQETPYKLELNGVKKGQGIAVEGYLSSVLNPKAASAVITMHLTDSESGEVLQTYRHQLNISDVNGLSRADIEQKSRFDWKY